MLHAYVDESERNEDYYFLGAIVGSKEQIFDMGEALKAVMRKHAETFPIKYTEELHGSAMMRAAKSPWKSLGMRARVAIYLDALVAVNESGVRVFIEGIDIAAQKARGYPNLEPAREVAFRYLFERIDECAGPGQRVQIHADDHHTAEVSRSNFTRYQIVGTHGYKSSKLQSIEPNMLFEDSQFELGLQAADLITYIYNRCKTIVEVDERATATKMKLWHAIRPAASGSRGRNRIWP
ncbi:hypothetical protein BG28_06525 [Nesterenkonia sp. AN1]|uniref:DUF3800 domain-containing protein n=1 Tax=Nesterenkonia sp. AN1 TaxID=652017 RepID=UPI00044E9E00|nr:DUF3800 domain-containing protein [Nesterenkonia sp. AN1]EXF24369.1 hypothetical protein BG28_06525 [Nesterenkonia sp. AN1]